MTPFIGTLGIKEPTNEQFAKDTFEPFRRKSLTAERESADGFTQA